MKIYHYQLPLKQFLLLTLYITLAFVFARWLHLFWKMDVVMAAVSNALLWATIPTEWLQKIKISRFLLLDAVYVGSFIAMDMLVDGVILSLAACILASCVYLLSNRLLTGLSGRLGMQAFIACVLLMGVHTWLGR